MEEKLVQEINTLSTIARYLPVDNIFRSLCQLGGSYGSDTERVIWRQLE